MSLSRVDLPQPFGPTSAMRESQSTCSGKAARCAWWAREIRRGGDEPRRRLRGGRRRLKCAMLGIGKS
eukprot:6210877-Pleurochrysis_carterae.AAC.2